MRSRLVRTAVHLALMGAAACGSAAGEEETAPDGGGGGSGSGSGGEVRGPCTTAELFAGHPRYTGASTEFEGAIPLKPTGATRPLRFRQIAFIGKHLFAPIGSEVWSADLSAPSPTLTRLTGRNSDVGRLQDGACATARIGSADYAVALADGSLLVADYTGNALLKVTDPAGPACRVSFFAGTQAARTDVRNVPVAAGDLDGPLATARFSGPISPVVAADGTIYFIDVGNEKVRKIAAGGTVSTVVPFSAGPEGAYDWTALALRGDKLYASASSGGNHSYVIEIDPAAGTAREYSKITPDELSVLDEDSVSVRTRSIVSDGTRVFGAGEGVIWEAKADGTVVHAAGGYSSKALFDGFPADVDFGKTVPAREAALKQSGQFFQWMTWHDGAIYWTGAHDLGAYIMKVSCPQ